MKIKIILFVLTVMSIILISCDLNDSVTGEEIKKGSELKLIINEYLASNDNCCTDENGEYDDWFEIYNYGTTPIDIGGMYVSDSKSDYTKHQIPKTNSTLTTIQPGGFLVLWCDGQPEQGVLHTNFKLGSGGEDITLTETDGRTVINELTYGPQTTDISQGRNPDGSENWQSFSAPTPGASNSGASTNLPPQIKNIKILPDSLTPTTPVIITAEVTDENDNLSTVKLFYIKDAITDSVNMTYENNLYKTDLGTFDDGSEVSFFISAIDDEGASVQSDTLSFQVGYVAPTLFINEFMASNDSSYFDPATNDYPDWIEIYNPGTKPIDIGGMYITDDLAELTVWQIPSTKPDSTTIAAGGFIVLLADKKPEAGILHVNLKLSGKGEQIGLVAPNGTTIIDSLTYTKQIADTSFGRFPDGSDNWQQFPNPTPGASNN
jgi:hypothetical protein